MRRAHSAMLHRPRPHEDTTFSLPTRRMSFNTTVAPDPPDGYFAPPCSLLNPSVVGADDPRKLVHSNVSTVHTGSQRDIRRHAALGVSFETRRVVKESPEDNLLLVSQSIIIKPSAVAHSIGCPHHRKEKPLAGSSGGGKIKTMVNVRHANRHPRQRRDKLWRHR